MFSMNIKDGYYRLNPKGNRKWLSLIDPIVFPLDSIQRHYPRVFLQDLIAIYRIRFYSCSTCILFNGDWLLTL